MIVGSILLAFGIDAWWDRAQERELESEMLAGLATDFAENQRQVEGQLGLRESIVTAASSLLEELKANPLPARVMVENEVLGSLLLSPTLDPITSTMDAALSSGQIGLISSIVVREHLADWRRVVTGLHENELSARDIVHVLLAPTLSSQTRLGTAAGGQAERVRSGASDQSGSEEVMATSELEGAVGLYLFVSTLVERDLRRLREIQTDLTLALEVELAR